LNVYSVTQTSDDIGKLPLHYALLKAAKLHSGINEKSGTDFLRESVAGKSVSKFTVPPQSFRRKVSGQKLETNKLLSQSPSIFVEDGLQIPFPVASVGKTVVIGGGQ
jgi:hypothetical protein